MRDEQAYVVEIVSTHRVEVMATSAEEAEGFVKDMHESGDACAELGDANYNTISSRFDKDGNYDEIDVDKIYSKRVVIPICNDETATAWCHPLPYDADQEGGLTEDQLDIILSRNDEELEGMSMDDKFELYMEDYGYGFTHLCIVDSFDLPKISDWSYRALVIEGGSDSAWYEACANYNDKVMMISKKIIQI